MEGFLPVSRADMKARGLDQLDFVFVSGDAYVDHPSFGPAIICRVLESHGYKVGIIPQPDWRSDRDFSRLGKPRLGFPFLEELCRHHISGQLKIAPEHISDRVTRLMGKSNKKTYLTFVKRFASINARLGKRQYLVPYFLSSHPGAELEDAVELAVFLHEMGYHPEQVQDFIATPGTLATCMYYTGLESMYTRLRAMKKRACSEHLCSIGFPKIVKLCERHFVLHIVRISSATGRSASSVQRIRIPKEKDRNPERRCSHEMSVL